MLITMRLKKVLAPTIERQRQTFKQVQWIVELYTNTTQAFPEGSPTAWMVRREASIRGWGSNWLYFHVVRVQERARRFCRSAFSHSLCLPETCSRGFFLSVVVVSLLLFGAEFSVSFMGLLCREMLIGLPHRRDHPIREKWQLGPLWCCSSRCRNYLSLLLCISLELYALYILRNIIGCTFRDLLCVC